MKERLGDADKVTLQGSTITKTIVNKEATKEENMEENSEEVNAVKESKKAAAIAAIKKNQEVLEMKAKMKKEATMKKMDAIKKTDELRKSKQELLDKLIDEQKKLILKYSKAVKAEEKTSMMSLIKSLSTQIDKTKEDIKVLLSQQNVRKSFLDVQTFSFYNRG